jgi:hypothetical protein
VRDAYPHLSGTRIRDVDAVDDHRTTRRFEQRSLHVHLDASCRTTAVRCASGKVARRRGSVREREAATV